MTFRLLIWVLATWSMGYFVLGLVWTTRGTSLIRACLALGIGAGISSCIFFVCLLFSPPLASRIFLAESATLAILMVFSWRTFRSRKTGPVSIRSSESSFGFKRLRFLKVTAGLIGALSLTAFLVVSFNTLHGEYDGWAIWNMRARFLFRGQNHWTDAFSGLLHYSHPDYPLLLPAAIARSWIYIGHETQAGPIIIGMVFTFATAALLWGALVMLRSGTQGLVAAAVLLGTPFFIAHGASQYADVPLGFYFLATLVLLNMHDRFGAANPWLLVLAGMTAGFAAWTKNEGLLFVTAAMLAVGACSAAARGWKVSLRHLIPFSIGLLPVLAMVLYFKTALAPANDLIAGQRHWAMLERLLTLSRYHETASAFVEQMFRFGEWDRFINMPVVLLFYLLLLGVELENQQTVIAASALAIVITAMGYFAIYIVTPRPLEWHLTASLNRLYLQLWPSVLFTYFLIVRSPEKAMSAEVRDSQPRARGEDRDFESLMKIPAQSAAGINLRSRSVVLSDT